MRFFGPSGGENGGGNGADRSETMRVAMSFFPIAALSTSPVSLSVPSRRKMSHRTRSSGARQESFVSRDWKRPSQQMVRRVDVSFLLFLVNIWSMKGEGARNR